MSSFKIALKDQSDYSMSLLLKEVLPIHILCYDLKGMNALYFDKETSLYKDICVNELIAISRKALNDVLASKMQNIDIEDMKKFVSLKSKIGNLPFMKDVIKSLFTECFNEKAYNEMNTNPYVINFKNGLVDLKSGQFRQRTVQDKYTLALDYDYEEKDSKDTQATINEIKSILKKVCNDDDKMVEFILSFFAYSITGLTNLEKFIYLYGATASNGKSTMINMMRYTFPIYFKELAQDTFEVDSAKDRHKHMNGLKNIRCCIVEESDRKKLDVNFIKKFVTGGQLENKVMYGTTETIFLMTKLIFISNNLPNFNTDEGFQRRIILNELKNRFVSESEFVNKKGTYKKDTTLSDKFKNNSFKLSFFKLLLPYVIDVLKTNTLKNEKIINQAKDICDDNDKMKQYIESHFIITNNDNDKIAKTSFLNQYRTFAEKPHISFMNILNDIKRLGYKYERTLRVCGEKGAVLGLKWKCDDDEGVNYDDVIEHVEIESKEKEDLKKENILLKQHIEEVIKELIKEHEDENKEREDTNEELENANRHIMKENILLKKQVEDLKKEMEDLRNQLLASTKPIIKKEKKLVKPKLVKPKVVKPKVVKNIVSDSESDIDSEGNDIIKADTQYALSLLI